MSVPILITGALGQVGAEVVRLLERDGQPVRAAVRATVANRGAGNHTVDIVQFDFTMPKTYGPAFEGVERMFLMRPPAIVDVRRHIFPALDAAKQAGVRQVVFLSLIGVEKNKILPHYKIEQHILHSGLEYTFLRPSFFMQNLSSTHREEIRDRSEIFVPAGSGKTSFIDVRDIAAVAARALTEEGHRHKIYELTGDTALDYGTVAAQLSEVLGRQITYRCPSLRQFIRQQTAQGTPMSFVLVMAAIYTTARLGLAGRVTSDIRERLGRAPIAFHQFAEDYASFWQPIVGVSAVGSPAK